MPYYITDACTGCTACKTICPTGAVTGQKKERHIIENQNCIDCGACGRVCAFSAVEDHFGRFAVRIKKNDWERPFFNLEACMACNICVDACPKGAIELELQKVNDPHAYPWLAREKDCMACGFCSQDCPVDAVEMRVRVQA